jgi:dTDP-4-amino-4,6-dideoxygalactose transaminase
MRAFPPAVPLPGTELASRTNLAIPMSPVLSAEQAAEVVQATGSHLAAGAPAL